MQGQETEASFFFGEQNNPKENKDQEGIWGPAPLHTGTNWLKIPVSHYTGLRGLKGLQKEAASISCLEMPGLCLFLTGYQKPWDSSLLVDCEHERFELLLYAWPICHPPTRPAEDWGGRHCSWEETHGER